MDEPPSGVTVPTFHPPFAQTSAQDAEYFTVYVSVLVLIAQVYAEVISIIATSTVMDYYSWE